jgi:hypothetical protein
VARTSDGRLILAYLREAPDRAAWQLRVAPVVINEETGDPTVETVAERTLADGCLPTAPVFSADARWVTGVLRADPPPRPLRRFAIGMGDASPHRPGRAGPVRRKGRHAGCPSAQQAEAAHARRWIDAIPRAGGRRR